MNNRKHYRRKNRIIYIFRNIILFAILALIIYGIIQIGKPLIFAEKEEIESSKNSGHISSKDLSKIEDEKTEKESIVMDNNIEKEPTINEDISEKIGEKNKSFKILQEPEGNLKIGLVENKVLGRDYMENTPHNYNASEYSFPTKDVYNWILNSATYTSDEKLVFLTFDDGPDKNNTPKILDILEQNDVHATFFLVGTSIEKEGASELVKRQIREGHSVGYHSYTHDYEILYPNRVANSEKIIGEIEKEKKLIQEITGIKNFSSSIFRYPGGHMSWKNVKQVDENLAQRGIYSVDWNALTGDSESAAVGRKGETPFQHIKNDIKSYGNPKVVVVLMHDNKGINLPYLKQIIDYFKQNNYKFSVLG